MSQIKEALNCLKNVRSVFSSLKEAGNSEGKSSELEGAVSQFGRTLEPIIMAGQRQALEEAIRRSFDPGILNLAQRVIDRLVYSQPVGIPNHDGSVQRVDVAFQALSMTICSSSPLVEQALAPGVCDDITETLMQSGLIRPGMPVLIADTLMPQEALERKNCRRWLLLKNAIVARASGQPVDEDALNIPREHSPEQIYGHGVKTHCSILLFTELINESSDAFIAWKKGVAEVIIEKSSGEIKSVDIGPLRALPVIKEQDTSKKVVN